MKKASLILGTLVIFATMVCFLSANVFAGKAADWPMGAVGYVKFQVIEGTVKSIDTKNSSFTVEGSDILGSEPLYVDSTTKIFKGTENTNLEDIHSAAQFTDADKLNFNALGVGDKVRTTFSIIEGKHVAVTLCQIRSK
ncbi:MAG TPA: hypothetical protein ACFYD6_03925 [Candidatus Brocadiia bacterium]|nr:hypothetical protein [Candidatus Brocadiales bacterium]